MTDLTATAATAGLTARSPRRRARSEWVGRALTILALMIGFAIIVFPVAGTYYNNYKAYEFAQSLENGAKGHGIDETALKAAQAYNASLSPKLLQDPWGGADPQGTPEYKKYAETLGGSQAVSATLRIPSVKTMLPVYHGTSEWALDKGAGHMYGTALPVGGPGTHAAIAAHRGLPNLTGFDKLPDVKLGDQLFVDVAGETLAYKVTSIDTVLPSDVSHLTAQPGQDLLTLITCTPYGINTHRLLVTATRIPWSQADQAQASWHGFDWSIQSWMWFRVVSGAVTLLIALVVLPLMWLRDDRRRARRLAARAASTSSKETS